MQLLATCTLSVLQLAATCDLFIARSTVNGAGFGLFAGRHFSKNDAIALDSSLIIKFSACEDNQLIYYVFGTDDDNFANLNLGVSMLLNHRIPKNTEGHLSAAPTPETFIPKLSYSTYPPVLLTAEVDIEEGAELFTSYGGNSWFKDRNISLSESADPVSTVRSIFELKRRGICLSDVEVKKSGIPNAGRGLFAERDFMRGELVTLSPALLLSKRQLQEVGAHSVIINYAISSEGSDAAILPFGRGAMVNNAGKEKSNIDLSWYNWKSMKYGGDISEITKKTLDELSKASAGAVNVAYVASRDIAAGEELTMYYGRNWEAKYAEYVIKMNSLHATSKAVKDTLLKKIRFREPIGAPDGMFPKSWLMDHARKTGAEL